MVCCLAGIFLVFGGCCVLVVVAWHTSTDVRRLFVLLPTDGGGLGDVDFDSLKGASTYDRHSLPDHRSDIHIHLTV